MFDLFHDPGHGRLHHLLRSHPLATERIKEAEFEDDLSEVPKTAFAWPAKERFPVHTREHAIVSYLYVKSASAREVPVPVVAEIETALEMYGVDRSIFEAVEEKVATLSAEECIFPEAGTYPVRNAEEVKTAEARLHEEYRKLLPEDRVAAFCRLAKAASDHGVELQGLSYKYAGMTYTDPQSLRTGLRARAGAAKDPEAKLAYEQLADAAASDRRSLRDRSLQVKLAEAIGTLDERHGLVRHYDRKLPDPMLTVFNTEKVASAGDVDLCGTMVSPAALASVDPKLFSDLLGPEILREIAPSGAVDPGRTCEVLNTLPVDLKRQLAQGLVQAGVAHKG